MGNCTQGNTEDFIDIKSQTLTKNDIKIIQDSWKHVVKGGLKEYGVNMMMRF